MYYTEKIRAKIDWRLSRIEYLHLVLFNIRFELYDDSELLELFESEGFGSVREIYGEISSRKKAIKRLYGQLRPENSLFPNE